MKKTVQLNTRLIKVEEVGDFYLKRTHARIRLEGKWIQHAGITPNQYIQITNPQPGVPQLSIVQTE